MKPMRLYQVGNLKELIWARDPMEARDLYIRERRKTDVYRMHYARSQVRVFQVPQAPLHYHAHVCDLLLVLPSNPNIVVTPHVKRNTQPLAGNGEAPPPRGIPETQGRAVAKGRGRSGRDHPGKERRV